MFRNAWIAASCTSSTWSSNGSFRIATSSLLLVIIPNDMVAVARTSA